MQFPDPAHQSLGQLLQERLGQRIGLDDRQGRVLAGQPLALGGELRGHVFLESTRPALEVAVDLTDVFGRDDGLCLGVVVIADPHPLGQARRRHAWGEAAELLAPGQRHRARPAPRRLEIERFAADEDLEAVPGGQALEQLPVGPQVRDRVARRQLRPADLGTQAVRLGHLLDDPRVVQPLELLELAAVPQRLGSVVANHGQARHPGLGERRLHNRDLARHHLLEIREIAHLDLDLGADGEGWIVDELDVRIREPDAEHFRELQVALDPDLDDPPHEVIAQGAPAILTAKSGT